MVDILHDVNDCLTMRSASMVLDLGNVQAENVRRN